MYLGKSGCIRGNVAVIGQKWLYSGESGVIQAQWLFSEQKWLYSGNEVLFGQNLLHSGKA